MCIRDSGCTVLFCSHSLYHVRQLCDSVLWLDQGRVKALGDTESVLASYEAHVRLQDVAGVAPLAAELHGPDLPPPQRDPVPSPTSTRPASLLSACLVDAAQAGAAEELPCLRGPDLRLQVLAHSDGAEAPSFGAVSYTHLDVYKRQSPMGLRAYYPAPLTTRFTLVFSTPLVSLRAQVWPVWILMLLAGLG